MTFHDFVKDRWTPSGVRHMRCEIHSEEFIPNEDTCSRCYDEWIELEETTGAKHREY